MQNTESVKTCTFKVIRVNWNQALYTSPGENVKEDRTSSDRSYTIILPEQLSPKVYCGYSRSITMEMITHEKMCHVNCRIILQNILALQTSQCQRFSTDVLSTNYSAFLVFAFIYIFPL